MSRISWADGQTGRVPIAGKTLEFACFGPEPEAAPTIVMLHEGLGSLAQWRDFPQHLARRTGCGVFAYSRAGYGHSDPVALPRPLDYMTQEALQSVPDLLDAIGVQRCILLGHSDGATIAAIYAGSHADHRIRGLILIAPHFFTEPTGLAVIAAAKTAFETGDLKSKLARYHRDPTNAFRGWNDAWLDPGFADWNVGDVIDYLRVPVLAIQGVEDQYGTRAQIDEIETRSYAPVDVEIIPGCGHAPHIEAPEASVAAVTGFIARLSRIEAAVVELA